MRDRKIRAARTVLAALALAVAAGGCAASTTASVTVIPRPAGSDDDLAAVTRELLPNGMRLIIQDHRASDIVAVYLWVKTGIRYEEPDQLGYAHFQEHMLFKGTDKFGPGHIDRATEGVGGRNNAVTSFDYTTFYIIVPSEQTATAIELLADMAFRSKFDPAEIAREREVIFEEGRIEADNPRAAIIRQLHGLVFGVHPYGRPVLGTTATMNGATHDKLVVFNRKYYTPENMSLVVVGPVKAPDVRAAVARTFGRAGSQGLAPTPAAAPAALTRKESRDVERAEQQAYLALGWQVPRADHPDSFAIDLLSNILAATDSSRLTRKLRDEERVVSGITMTYAALMGSGLLSLRCDLEAADLATVEQRVLEEIRRVQEDGVTERELKLAITRAESDHAFQTETSEGLAYAYGIAETTWRLEEELAYVDRVRAVTREQIQAAARRYLSTSTYARIAFLPKGK
jgi:zinc protease